MEDFHWLTFAALFWIVVTLGLLDFPGLVKFRFLS